MKTTKRKNGTQEIQQFANTKVGETIALGAISTCFTAIMVAGYLKSYEGIATPSALVAMIVISSIITFLSTTIYVLPSGKTYRIFEKGRNLKRFAFSLKENPEFICVSDYTVEFDTFWGHISMRMDCSLSRTLPDADLLNRAVVLSGTPKHPEYHSQEQATVFCNRMGIILKEFSYSVNSNYSEERFYSESLSVIDR